VLWVGAVLALAAAVLLAFVPRLPSPSAPAGLGLAGGGVRVTAATNRRLRIFAAVQVACSFVLLAGAATVLTTLVTLQSARTGYDMRNVLAFDIPVGATGSPEMRSPKTLAFYEEAMRRIRQLPSVEAAAVGSTVPWRDAGDGANLNFPFGMEGYTPADGEERPRALHRFVSAGFFSTLGIPVVAGREFTEGDRKDAEPVAVISRNAAQRFFPNGDAVNGRVQAMGGTERIVGVVADVDDENVADTDGHPSFTVYLPIPQTGFGGRLFVRSGGDSRALIPAVTRTIRELSAEQAVERAATLEDVRSAVLSPKRVNAFVFSGFAGIALLIAVVGVAGVLAFTVSARTREFGMRLAIGCSPRQLLTRVLSEGATIAAIGIGAGAAGGYALARVAARLSASVELPGAVAVASAALLLIAAAVGASLMPAVRASRVDVMDALRSE
jgi:putative ABC transport system permease protein